jgi:hypothetical protein
VRAPGTIIDGIIALALAGGMALLAIGAPAMVLLP